MSLELLPMTVDLSDLLAAELGGPVGALDAAYADDVAAALRAIASLPTPTPADRRLAARLFQAAELIAPTVPPVGAG